MTDDECFDIFNNYMLYSPHGLAYGMSFAVALRSAGNFYILPIDSGRAAEKALGPFESLSEVKCECLVRGLDFLPKTAFEIRSVGKGYQTAFYYVPSTAPRLAGQI